MDDEQTPTTEIHEADEPTQSALAPTENMPAADEAPAVDTDPASMHDVAAAAGSYARSRFGQLRTFVVTHRFALAAVMALGVAAILGIALLVGRLADMPDQASFMKDAQTMLSAPDYSGGAYGSDEPLVLRNLEVTNRRKQAAQPNECLVSGVATFSNGAVEALQEAQLTYERKDGTWTCTGAEAVGGASYRAVTGLETDKVLSSMSGILQRAETSFSEEQNGTALPSLYADAQATITSDSFDAETQTEVMSLHLARSATFTAYECDVQATFAFRPSNGLWELTAATASDNAKDITLSPLMGTWTGTFREQTSSKGKCFGAKASDLRIVVTSVSNDKITGTLSGIVHYHGEVPEDTDASEGDTELSGVPFSGTMLREGSGISFTCTTPQDASGVVELSLLFGTQDDPSAARAVLTTTHAYEASWFIFAYDTEATFSDTFVLTRE